MFEPVLCVTKNDFESLFQSLHAPVPGNTTVYVHGVTPQQWRDLSVPYAFVGRDACETDDDLKQMIPYVIVRHGGKYLAYSRTSQSGEKRLVGKRSVGIGGHINPTDVPDGDPPLNAILRRCAAREIKEELDTDIAVDGFFTNVQYDYPDFHLDMDVFRCHVIGGRLEVNPEIHGEEAFIPKESLLDEPWCPADEIIAKRIIEG